MLMPFPDLPCTLNEYMAPSILYKYFPLKDALEYALKPCSLGFRSPLAYNDPFDCNWGFGWWTRTPEWRAQARDMLHAASSLVASDGVAASPGTTHLLETLRSLSDDQRSQAIESLLRKFQEKPVPPQGTLRLLAHANVLCMTSVRSSMLMWSHYAEKHSGMALGFDRCLLEHAFGVKACEVRYCEALPNINDYEAHCRVMLIDRLEDDPQEQRLGRDLYYSKSKDWQYEREWRFVLPFPEEYAEPANVPEPEQAPHDRWKNVAVPRAALVQVVFGMKASQANKDQVIQTLVDSGFSPALFECHRALGRFAIDVVPCRPIV